MSNHQRKTQYQGVGFLNTSNNEIGGTRSLQGSEDNRLSQTSQMDRLVPINAQNTITIPYSEIIKMKEHSIIGENTEAARKAKQRQDLYAISQEKAKNWANTIYTMRKRKDDARYQQFKQEEEQRRKIDAEEAKFKAEERKKVIQKANKQLYENTDKVRSFQSKLLLVDALHERDAQMELQNQIQEVDQIREKMYDEQTRELIRIQELEDEEKQKQLQVQKEYTQKVLKEQHDDMKIRYIKKLQDEKIEGEIVKQKAIDAIEKEKIEEAKRRQRAIDLQEEVKQNNQHLIQLKEDKLYEEKLEEQKILDYAHRKDVILQMRQDREHQMFLEKQQQKQQLIDAQTKILLELKSQEDQRISHQIKEAEIKAENVEKQKREYRENLKKRIDESLNLTMAQQSAMHEWQQREDQDFQNHWNQKNNELKNQEIQENQEKRLQNQILANHHIKQSEDKQKKREEDFIKELEQAERIQQQIENDDLHFQSWAERAVNEWSENGQNIKPLLSELTQSLRTTQ